jgi:vacuolar-type H+-ATPase subunit H
MGLDAVAMFGKSIEQKPYWMVDAQLLTGNSSKGLKIDFLAGSMYKNMAPSSKSDPFIQTLSGVTYEPNFSAGWGGRFAVAFSKGNSMAVAAGLEIQTRADGAISKIGFIGRAAFAGNDNSGVNKEIIIQQYLMMCKDSDLSRSGGIAGKLDNDPGTIQIISDRFTPSGEGGIKGTTASIIVRFDFENDSYYGKLGVSFTAPAFAIQAVGAFLSSPNKWFVHIGEPPLSSRIIIISPSLPPINGYFMIGDGIAALPDPQPNIFVKYPSKKGERNANIEPSTVATGRGIALGGAVFFQPPRLNILGILDFSVYAQAGFDFMLIKYDDGFYCSNRPGQPLGVNNWRAMGQLYAMASFAAKAFGFNVLSLDAGALLRAASPNPTYATGQVAVSFRALMKKFRFNVGFTLGEDCEVAKSDQFLENLSLIKTKFPEFGAQVSPNTIPNITGTEAFDKDIEDPSFEGKYQLKLNPVEVKTEKGEIVAGTTSIKDDMLTFTPEKPFPAFQKVYMKSKAQVFLNQNGSLTPAQIEGGYVEEPVTLMFIATKTDAEMKAELEGHKAKIAADAKAIKNKAAETAKQIQEKTDNIVNALNNSADSVAAAFIANCSNCSQAGLDSLKKIGGEMTTGVNSATANADSTIGKILKKALKEVDDVVDKAEKEAIEVLEKGEKNIEELQQKAKDELEQYAQDILKIYQGYCSSTFSWQGTLEGFRDSQIACLNYRKEAESKIKDKEDALKIFYGKLKQDEVDYAKNTTDQIMAKAQADCDAIMNAAGKECQTVIDELKKQCESIMQAASEKCKKIQGYSEKINMDEFIHNLFNKIDFSVITDPGKTVINNCIDPSNPQIIVSNKNITKGQSVNLTGSGCAINTTYLWNGSYIGANWSVTVNETQVYMLECMLANCEAKKTFVTINVTADVTPADINGQNNSIASSGNNGSTQNNNENNSSSGSSNGNTETNPNPENTNQNNNVHHPCEGISNPNAWVSNSNVYVGTRVDLSANGCADGSQYSWTDLGVNAQSTSTTVEKSTYYNIKCVKTGCEDRWGGVYVEAIPPPADPCSYLASPSISGNSQINTGQQVNLGAYGCIAGSSYSWDTGDEGQNLSVSPNSSRYYTVTCIKSHCENQSASIYINVTDPCEGHHQPNVYADNYDVYYGQSTVLHASCPGGSTLSWDTGSSSADRTITINGNYVATAQCTREGCETTSASITINGLVPVSNNTNSNNNYNDYNSYNSYNSFINYSNYNANFYTNGYY